jgi:hypothetical protein
MKGVTESPRLPNVPPAQQNLQEAAALALSAARAQPPEQLEWLGGRPRADRWRLEVLDDVLTVDLAEGAVRTSEGRAVGPWWQILTLHYLATSSRPAASPPEVTFAALKAGRAYAGVYQKRVIERLCRTVGRDRASLLEAARRLGGQTVAAGDAAFDFQVYPRLRLRLVWYAGEEAPPAEHELQDLEPRLPPSAALLLPSNIEAFLAVEDIVVLSERIVSRLSGGRF